VIALFTAAMAERRTPRIDGDGKQSRDFTYVANAVQALMKSAVAPAAVGKIYNIGTGTNINLLELVEELNRLLGLRIQPEHGPARPGDVRHSQADISLARKDLSYEPAVSFAQGLKRTLDAFLAEKGGGKS
jgi:UDP-glucose 4-epimerase